MKRIIVIGIAGSGKSTLANKLGEILGLPVIHLDKEYWTKDWKRKYENREDWENWQKEIVKKDEWIIDGGYKKTIHITYKIRKSRYHVFI